jgi:cbb3-type cytochrome oxidase maturation protein
MFLTGKCTRNDDDRFVLDYCDFQFDDVSAVFWLALARSIPSNRLVYQVGNWIAPFSGLVSIFDCRLPAIQAWRMDILFFAIPIALFISLIAVLAFVYQVRSGQFDDLETPPLRILFDDVESQPEREPGGEEANELTSPEVDPQ